ncbi:methylamine utilization protein MauJ [Chryseobacterium sp. ISL-6]|uniref:methylamine utilization protein MauJ n=1 Tax=Chryseobacterium sp. ISL-6 TaxID=2819143 RepID=UPI001BECAFEF|nr:methylamine utilization protein MauJ [Chryseobacterium sp. ISL-6]MBT2622837.1 hypothetical protein [Chryseobacterium sp. ISL-6]
MRIYEVELNLSGTISLQSPINFSTEKELEIGAIFNSSVKINNNQQGLKISTTVRTNSEDKAKKIALLFIGKMLDVLSFKLNKPLNISDNEIINKSLRGNVRAIIEKNEFREAFEISRNLNLNHTTFLRGLNWYRKGLYSDDPFDKFLAFWNSVSIVASKYHTPNARTSNGSINQIWNCFETLWSSDISNWEGINNNDRWINEMSNIRNNIAHGLIPIEIEYVEDVIGKLDNVKDVAYKFLNEWFNSQLTN